MSVIIEYQACKKYPGTGPLVGLCETRICDKCEYNRGCDIYAEIKGKFNRDKE